MIARRRAAARAALARVPWWEVAGVLGGYLLMAVIISWPLAANMGHHIAGGGSGGDQSGYLWDFWNISEHGLSLWGTDLQETISAPFGRESPGSVNVTLLSTLGPAWVVASIWSPIVAYNVTVFLALTLSAAAMYMLARWVGAGRWIAGWAGGAFMLFPYETLRAQTHVPLAHIWCLPLVVLVGLRWLERPSWRRALWMAAGLAACWVTNPYYGTMGFVIVGVCVLVAAVRMARGTGWRPMLRRVGEAVGAVVLVVLVPLGILFTVASGSIDQSLRRDPVELVLYGARLSDYLLPSIHNGFYAGLFGAERWADIGSPGGERTAFVGYVTLLLAALAVGLVLGGRAAATRQRLAVVTSLPLLVALLLFSSVSPVSVFGRAVDMPATYIFEALPYLRVFARFAAAVMVVLLMLAAIGLTVLLRNRSVTAKVAVMSAAIILSAAELPIGAPTAMPVHSDVPLRVEGLEARDVPTWAWLRQRDTDEIVYEYPGGPNEALERFYMYGQTLHGHRITNGSISPGQIGDDFMKANGTVTWPGVPGRLAALGIDLVTINPWAYAMAGLETPPVDDPPEGFELVRTFPNGSAVWRVTADPADAVAIPRQAGWWDPELVDGEIWRWMTRSARVTVVAPSAGRYRISFRARALGAEDGDRQRVWLSGPSGDTTRRTVGTERPLSFVVELPAGRSDVWIETEGPRPRRPSPADARLGTIQVSDWTVTRAAARVEAVEPAEAVAP